MSIIAAIAFCNPVIITVIIQNKDASVQQQLAIMTGLSPGASVKREKLQQRNAILRRTGFLEGPPRVSGVGGMLFQHPYKCNLQNVCILSIFLKAPSKHQ